MEEYIRIIEDLICEFYQSGEKERYEQAKALEILLSLLGEIDDKEASDALHMLFHCALTNKDFETQKQQFQIVNAYIKQLEEENEEWQRAYQEEKEKQFELLRENKKMAEEYLVNNPGMAKYLNDNYIFKSKVIEKIEELSNEEDIKYTWTKTNRIIFKEDIIDILQEILREE